MTHPSTTSPPPSHDRVRAARRAAGWLIEAGGLAILATQAWRIA